MCSSIAKNLSERPNTQGAVPRHGQMVLSAGLRDDSIVTSCLAHQNVPKS
jgi:hypothetical protein